MGDLFLDYDDDPVSVAKRLLGQRLVREIDGARLAGTIVETEAYLGATDRAAHTFNGRRTPRNESMYLPGGHAYVYFVYGLHYCLNMVCGKQDEGVAVLIRALEPAEGVDRMKRYRPAARSTRELCAGPARLTRALGIDRNLDGHDLRLGRWLFVEQATTGEPAANRIRKTPRIGVDYAGPWSRRLLRFCIRDHPCVSR